MRRKPKTMPAIVRAESPDGTRVIIKCGRHYALYSDASDFRKGKDQRPLRERVDAHVAKLEKTYKRGYRPLLGRAGKPATSPRAQARSKRDLQERMAIDYARWLAARDGLIVSGEGRVHFASAAFGMTPCYVTFCERQIDLPHWDWVPADPVDESDGAFPRSLAA